MTFQQNPVSKTVFERYLNDNGIPEEYIALISKHMVRGAIPYGSRLRKHHSNIFEKLYKDWLLANQKGDA